MSNPASQNGAKLALDGVLDEIEDYLERHQDVRDGPDGQYRPNEAMSLLNDLRWWRESGLKAQSGPTERYEAMVQATKSHVDGRDLLYQLNPNGAHMIDIHVRINGEWKVYEGDWLKTLMWARDGNRRGGRPEVVATGDPVGSSTGGLSSSAATERLEGGSNG